MEGVQRPGVRVKKKRIRELYAAPVPGGRRICIDEFGPLNVVPRLGRNWGEKADLVPATYSKKHGVRHMFAMYDLERNKLYGTVRKRKRWMEFLSFLKSVRRRYPQHERLYAVLDNYGPHKKAEVVEYAETHNIKFVPTPTNASWLNRIECHFWPLREFALNNSNYSGHEEQTAALMKYLRWRNKHPRNKKVLKIQKRHDLT